MQDLVSNGLLVGLGDYLEEYAPEMLEKAGVLMDACYVGDDYYCVPGNYYPAMEEAVVYDVAVFDEYNIEIPENPEATYEYENKLFDNIKTAALRAIALLPEMGSGLILSASAWTRWARPRVPGSLRCPYGSGK